MNSYKTQFIDNAIACGALKFGQFRLKSGRISPHFFNAGEFYRGKALATLGQCYAAAIVDSGIEFDVLFGPAYKGITLAAATSVALAEHHNVDVPYCFNRKEVKSHGEGGTIVGAPLEGKVLIIDDVITAGTAIREVMAMVDEAGFVNHSHYFTNRCASSDDIINNQHLALQRRSHNGATLAVRLHFLPVEAIGHIHIVVLC